MPVPSDHRRSGNVASLVVRPSPRGCLRRVQYAQRRFVHRKRSSRHRWRRELRSESATHDHVSSERAPVGDDCDEALSQAEPDGGRCAALLALAPIGTAGAQDEPAWDAWDQVTGNNGSEYIADSQGRALQLRGVNIKTGNPADGARDEVLDAIAARGFNLLRLSLFWEQLEPQQGDFDQAYLDDIDAVITAAEQRGIWVVVSFHQDTFGSAFGGHGIPPWATKDDGLPFEPTGSFLTDYLQPGVQAAWENLYEDPEIRAAQANAWTHVAAEYADHPNVIGYDLLNEPFGKIREGEDLLTAAKRVESVQLTAMYQRLTDAIRTVDARSWMFIEAPNLASLGISTSLGRVNDERVVFSLTCTTPTSSSRSTTVPATPAASTQSSSKVGPRQSPPIRTRIRCR